MAFVSSLLEHLIHKQPIPGHLLVYLASYWDVIYFEDRGVYLGLSVAWNYEFTISCDKAGNMCWIHNPFIG